MAITIDGTNGLTTDNAALKLDGTTLVVDDTNNRVGIGTASPAAKLDLPFAGSSVAGLKMSDTNGGNLAAYALFYNTSASQTAGIQNANNAGIHVNVGTGGSLCFGNGYTAANALDDYEEGTWTPVPNSTSTPPTYNYTSPSVSGRGASYTKVGNMVVAWFDQYVNITSAGSGVVVINGLPFTSAMNTNNGGYSAVQFRATNAFGSSSYVTGYVSGSNIIIELGNGTSTSNGTWTTGNDIRFTGFVAYFV